MVDTELEHAILRVIREAEGPQRSLMSTSELAQLLQARLHLAPLQVTETLDALSRANLITGIGDSRTGLRFVRLTDLGRRGIDTG
jgi:DNA-binding MarR family transcriptional regulator